MELSLGILGAVFLTALLGGVHCAGMCGGIVAALSGRAAGQFRLQAGYQIGRIASYAAAGAVAGGIGSLGLLLSALLPVQLALYVLANLMLIALGLYLTGMAGVTGALERAGQRAWRHIQPLARCVLPAHTVPRALALGALWGWLPCGLVYSVLFTALLTGDPLRGAGLMLAFGLGTVPNLLLAGLTLNRMRRWSHTRALRWLSGGLVLGFGAYGLAHAARLDQHIKNGLLCFG